MTLSFNPVSINDRERYIRILEHVQMPGCGYAFGNLFTWAHGFDTAIAFDGDTAAVRTCSGGCCYSAPFCSTDIVGYINSLPRTQGELKLFCLERQYRDALCRCMPGHFEFTPVRDLYDYVYLREELAQLPGRRYHKKKNHFAGFVKNYSFKYEELDSSNIEECLAFSEAWSDANVQYGREAIENERLAVRKAFEYYRQLGYVGAALRVDGNIVAYCTGERLNSEVFCTHFEKALPEYTGAYAAINKLFAENHLCSYKYVNREDDTGDDGLRQAKLSYHPAILLEKYNARGK